MSLRTKFLAISVTLTLISLLLFTHVIYDKAIDYKHLLEQNSFRVLTEQLITQYDSKAPSEKFDRLLIEQINNSLPARAFVTYKDSVPLNKFYDENKPAALLFDNLSKNIKKNIEANEGFFEIENESFFWLKYPLPHKTEKELSLVAIFPLSATVITETLGFFGTPLFISGFLLLWAMVWASIILSSLVEKLQDQKQILSDQALDIRKSHDEALHANQAKSTFLANMSHEIRTPLTSIIGFAEACLDADQSMQERYNATSTIIKSGNHLLNIINEILDISKIEAGKLEIELTPVKLIDLLQEVNMFINILAEEKGLIFGINYSFPLPNIIITDQLRLKQILINICSNAIKFTEKGHVFLNISYQTEHSILAMEIVDTGVGMTNDQTKQIFTSFQQADNTITRQYGGTGLGLTLSKQFTEMLNGEIKVESTPDVGSKFSIQIKAQTPDQNDLFYDVENISEGVEKNKLPSPIPIVTGRILVAEDNPDIRALVNLFICKAGAEIVMANNGEIAVKKAKDGHFDLIFLDIQMPVMDGFEALHQIRMNGYTHAIYAMTANTLEQDQEKCLMAGFDGFVKKPIDKNELYSVISSNLTSAKITTVKPDFITSSMLEEEPQLLKLVDDFLERIPEIMDCISQALSDKNLKELSSHVHQIKGIGGAFGYQIITKIAEKIEFSLNSQDFNQISLLVDDLQTICDQAVAGKDENHKIIEQLQKQ